MGGMHDGNPAALDAQTLQVVGYAARVGTGHGQLAGPPPARFDDRFGEKIVRGVGDGKAEPPPEALRAAQDAYDMVPRARVTDVLLEVDGWTGFSECLTHQRSGRPAEDRAAPLTTILADGINLGLTRMAEACRGHTLRQLAWMHDWYVREGCDAAALVLMIEVHRALPLARVWGDGSTSSSDGQFFRAGGRGEALGDINAIAQRSHRVMSAKADRARQRARGRVLHPRLGPVRAVPHQSHRGDRFRGAASAGRAAPARHRAAPR